MLRPRSSRKPLPPAAHARWSARTVARVGAGVSAGVLGAGILATSCTASREPRLEPPAGSPQVDAATSSPPPPTASVPAPPAPDASPVLPALTAADCFKDLAGPVIGPDYDQFKPTIGKSCAGTHHQNIAGVQKVVFLGDSVTVGTPPTPPGEYYRLRLEPTLKQRFGPSVEFASCAKWGARTDDLLEGGQQIAQCFPTGVEPKTTLVIMTNGGNDTAAWAKDKLSTAAAMVAADAAVLRLQQAVEWLKSPTHFPNGSFVVYSNVYEFTDTSGQMSSCPAAVLAGMGGSWPEGKPAVVHFEEGFMKVAVETKSDMMFLLEHFCGHGYRRDDPSLQCYRGPNSPLWFDLTCYHPNPTGHAEIALQFAKVIDGL